MPQACSMTARNQDMGPPERVCVRRGTWWTGLDSAKKPLNILTLFDFSPFDFTPSVPDFRTACNGSIADHGFELRFDLGGPCDLKGDLLHRDREGPASRGMRPKLRPKAKEAGSPLAAPSSSGTATTRTAG